MNSTIKAISELNGIVNKAVADMGEIAIPTKNHMQFTEILAAALISRGFNVITNTLRSILWRPVNTRHEILAYAKHSHGDGTEYYTLSIKYDDINTGGFITFELREIAVTDANLFNDNFIKNGLMSSSVIKLKVDFHDDKTLSSVDITGLTEIMKIYGFNNLEKSE